MVYVTQIVLPYGTLKKGLPISICTQLFHTLQLEACNNSPLQDDEVESKKYPFMHCPASH